MSDLERQPTESTPLINRATQQASPSIVELETVVRATLVPIQDADLQSLQSEIRCVVDPLQLEEKDGAALELLLFLRLSMDFGRSNTERERAIAQAWAAIRESGSTKEDLSKRLWKPFKVLHGLGFTLSLFEVLMDDESAVRLDLVTDAVLSQELMSVWKGGRPFEFEASSLDARIERLATPRSFYLVDLAIHILYITALTDYLKDPRAIFYDFSSSAIDYRLYFIVIQSFARSITASQASRSPFFITFLAFVWKLVDTSPGSHDFCFFLVMYAFFQHVLHLLLPLPPSLILLIPESSVFPLSSVLLNLLADVVGPVALFFLPIFALLLIILAMYLRTPLLSLSIISTPPDEVWLAIFYILCFIFLIMLLLIFHLSVARASHVSSTPTQAGVPRPWDLYGNRSSISVRRHFFAAVRHYSAPYFFPAPLNLIPHVVITLPCLILFACRQRHAAAWVQDRLRPILWRSFSLPLGLIFGITWGWRRT